MYTQEMHKYMAICCLCIKTNGATSSALSRKARKTKSKPANSASVPNEEARLLSKIPHSQQKAELYHILHLLLGPKQTTE